MNTEAIDNLIARMQRAEQERDALRETVLSIGAQRDELLAKLDAAMKERDAARSEVDAAWRNGMTDAANISGSGGCLCPEDILSARDAKTSTT